MIQNNNFKTSNIPHVYWLILTQHSVTQQQLKRIEMHAYAWNKIRLKSDPIMSSFITERSGTGLISWAFYPVEMKHDSTELVEQYDL